MSDERMEQNRQPEKTDVVFFSPEMLRLADQHRREQQERLENCRQAAQNGDCAAAVQMGLHYFYGTGGVKKDPDKAFAWFSRTEPDDPTALYWLAVCHDNGTGVERDPVRAFELFQESAKLGYLPAVCDLGVCYERGEGVERDAAEAARLYRARNGGDSIICRELLAKAGAAPSGGTKAEARTADYYKKRPCPELCRMCADLCAEFIAAHPEGRCGVYKEDV